MRSCLVLPLQPERVVVPHLLTLYAAGLTHSADGLSELMS